jgi:23S rRNA pseudouridine1911/1915/1917 synthase
VQTEPHPGKDHLTRRIQQSAVAPDSDAGKRFDQVAAAVFPDFSRARLQQWIRDGALTVDGLVAKPTLKIKGGETLLLDAEPEVESSARPEDIPLDLIHADEDIIVLNKPAGLVVHPAPGNPAGTLVNALLHFDPQLATLPRAGVVHRLDKDTTGVMVVARSLRAHTSLVDQLQKRSMSRVYRAVAVGELISGGTVDAPIGRHPRDRKRMAVVHSGKPAVTHFRIVERYRGFTYLEVRLETGRTHQIRVHLADQGFSLLGDPVYGKRWAKTRKSAPMTPETEESLRAFPRQALHAWRLTLEHPADGSEHAFEAPLPDDFSALLRVLRREIGKKQ